MSVKAGERLRQMGQDQATNAADMRVVAMIDAEIRTMNASGMKWSANDIRNAVTTHSHGLVGARVDAARKRGEMELVGYTPSNLTSTRGHRICVWRGKSEAGSSPLSLLGACCLMLTLGLIVGYLAVSPLLTLDLAR